MNKRYELVITGVGGTGVLTIGRMLMQAGTSQYKHVSYWPHYGSLVRGGDSECTVILSDEVISSPLVLHPEVAIVMGLPQLKPLEARMKSGGVMIVDSSSVPEKVARTDLKAFYVPATRVATEMGSKQVANLIMLGACLEVTHPLPLEVIEKAMEQRFGKSPRMAMNLKALREGSRLVAAGAAAK